MTDPVLEFRNSRWAIFHNGSRRWPHGLLPSRRYRGCQKLGGCGPRALTPWISRAAPKILARVGITFRDPKNHRRLAARAKWSARGWRTSATDVAAWVRFTSAIIPRNLGP